MALQCLALDINYPYCVIFDLFSCVISLCVLLNYLNVRKLSCLMIFSLLVLISSLYKPLGWVLDTLSALVLYSQNIFCNFLSFFISMYCSSSISVTSTFIFHSLTQLVKFFNSLCCTIFLVRIRLFIVFLFQSIHIQIVSSLQGC